MFRHIFALCTLAVSLTVSGAAKAEDGSEALEKLPDHDAIVSIQANLALTRISCVESDRLLNEIQTSLYDQPPTANVEELKHRFKSLKARVGTPQHPVYLLQQDMKVISDRRRTRNESSSRSNGQQLQATQVKVEGTYVEYQNGNAVIDTAGIIQLEDLGSLFPYRLIERLRTMQKNAATKFEVSRNKDGATTNIVVDNQPARFRAGVFASDENLMIKTRVAQGSYVEECYYAGFEKHEDISVPICKIKVRLIRDADNKTFVSGTVELTEIQDMGINQPLSDAVFAVAIPEGTLVQKFDGVRELEQIVTARPVDDLAAQRDSLSAIDSTPRR